MSRPYAAEKCAGPGAAKLAGLDARASRGFCFLVLCLIWINIQEPCCAEATAIVPEIQARGRTFEKPLDATIWGTSGSKVPIVVDLVAPLGASGALDCEFFQASEDLAARLPGGGELVADLNFSDRTFRRFEVQVPMPEVERETTIVVLLSLKSKSDGHVLASKKVPIRLIPGPQSHLNPISRLRRLPEGTLLVTGESPRIRGFFDKMNILYVDGLTVSSGVSSVVLSEGDEMPSNIPGGLPALVFSKPGRLLPGVYADSKDGARRIKVTLPVLDLITSDVLAQRTFTDLIFSALSAQQKTEP